ncbi:hypothetical protein B0H17DRAFT_1220238 [Mycena rosella]|uniref:Uncharacterized protein n=1 Tax=Mycena rosella TaxID=1033263 RepID=A0AAD7BCF3_MYCRO|nr:hypothetical protein B0H17DRAFT_1220238 [Mycena rosella]
MHSSRGARPAPPPGTGRRSECGLQLCTTVVLGRARQARHGVAFAASSSSSSGWDGAHRFFAVRVGQQQSAHGSSASGTRRWALIMDVGPFAHFSSLCVLNLLRCTIHLTYSH